MPQIPDPDYSLSESDGEDENSVLVAHNTKMNERIAVPVETSGNSNTRYLPWLFSSPSVLVCFLSSLKISIPLSFTYCAVAVVPVHRVAQFRIHFRSTKFKRCVSNWSPQNHIQTNYCWISNWMEMQPKKAMIMRNSHHRSSQKIHCRPIMTNATIHHRVYRRTKRWPLRMSKVLPRKSPTTTRTRSSAAATTAAQKWWRLGSMAFWKHHQLQPQHHHQWHTKIQRCIRMHR